MMSSQFASGPAMICAFNLTFYFAGWEPIYTQTELSLNCAEAALSSFARATKVYTEVAKSANEELKKYRQTQAQVAAI